MMRGMTSTPAESRDFGTIGVIGLGTMGAGIAEVFARNGYRPVVRSVLKSPDLASWRHKYNTGPTFNIRDRLFGGWLKANRVWFDQNTGRMVGIERVVGG